ncbi:MAG: tetratricopeptide repeat protein [Nitrospira sp. SB0677_bin_15]|nr:tetratricopeptide repeat protein [Nitrospira sp. SB0667_bin_9]MYG41285.1 tetratricopeptide repeat protein [Nitrospira sp. SB0677_bin_15]
MNQRSVKESAEYCLTVVLCATLLCFVTTQAFAEEQRDETIDAIAELAEAEWLDGNPSQALHVMGPGLQAHPDDFRLLKLRADVLATASRRHQEAVEAYDVILDEHPESLEVRWAKWSVLLRAGQQDQAIAEFQRIAQLDVNNPIVALRLAQELRKVDRLEESLEWYKKAVAMIPDMVGWRLALARAKLDVLDGRGARDEVEYVLRIIEPGSPEEAAAHGLRSVIYGATKERGRRFEPILSPGGTASERKAWSAIRADAWRLFDAGRYEEVEPIYRKLLALKPDDYAATHELGMTLLALERCDEAIQVFESMSGMNPSDEVYADAFFRIGRCLMKMEKWIEALAYFEILYDAALEFDEQTKEVPPKADLRVLNTETIATWVKRVKEHIPADEIPKQNPLLPAVDPNAPAPMTEEELYHKIATERLNPAQQIYTRASLMGRDSDFSMFRYVIPANHVMRDDRPTGTHEFIPIEPHDTFPNTQEEIYLMFGLVTASHDEMPLSVECFLETPKSNANQIPLARDQVIMNMGDQTGYFIITQPESGWTSGLHRCGLYVGSELSAYTHSDEIRFRIIPETS